MITVVVFTGISKCLNSQSWIFKILFLITQPIYVHQKKAIFAKEQ